MRVVATLLVIALLVGWVATNGAAGSVGATLAELVTPLAETVRELFAWPSPQPGRAETETRVVQLPPKVVELPPKVVELPPKERNWQGWITVCAPGGAFYVPKEVFDTGAVCDDPSLGVPLREARDMSREDLGAQLEAIRQRYLSQQGN